MQVVIRGRMVINVPPLPQHRPAHVLSTKFTGGIFQSICVKWQFLFTSVVVVVVDVVVVVVVVVFYRHT